MNSIDRLQELLVDGERRQAETFAKEALRNERATVDCEDDRVVVETPTFRGKHGLERPFDRTDPDAVRAAVDERGTYRPRENPDLLEFDCGLPDAVVDAIVEPAEDGGEETAEESVDGDGDGDGDGAGTRDSDPPSDVDRSGPASLLERTVARLRG